MRARVSVCEARGWDEIEGGVEGLGFELMRPVHLTGEDRIQDIDVQVQGRRRRRGQARRSERAATAGSQLGCVRVT